MMYIDIGKALVLLRAPPDGGGAVPPACVDRSRRGAAGFFLGMRLLECAAH
jgi:hypothetical protein